MAKFEKASDDLINLFETIRDKTTIPQWVRLEVLFNKKQKETCKIFKMNTFSETITDGINFAFVFNKEIIMQLSKYQQEIEVKLCLNCIYVSETGTISMEKPNFNMYKGILEKYGYDSLKSPDSSSNV